MPNAAKSGVPTAQVRRASVPAAAVLHGVAMHAATQESSGSGPAAAELGHVSSAEKCGIWTVEGRSASAYQSAEGRGGPASEVAAAARIAAEILAVKATQEPAASAAAAKASLPPTSTQGLRPRPLSATSPTPAALNPALGGGRRVAALGSLQLPAAGELKRRSHFSIGPLPVAASEKCPSQLIVNPVRDAGRRAPGSAALPVAATKAAPGMDTIARLQQMLPGLRLVGADTADVQV